MGLAGSLDLYVLLVNYVFGNIFLSLLGVAVILFITGIMGRMSIQSILVIVLTFMCAVLIGYFGSIVAIIFFLVSAYYMISGIINWIQQMRT